MKQVLVAVALAASLSGCMSVQDWSEAPLAMSAPIGAPPGPWWGQDVASVAVFDTALAPHGIWGTHSRFGRVFLPSGIGPGWQPYTRGQWVRDPRFGTVFAGADPFGWTTYHYGRWGRDDRFGWFWIPDTRFAPPVGLAGAAGGWAAGQADWNRWNGGWNGGWGAPWGAGWGGGHPGWNTGWNTGWNAGWHPGWNAGWGRWNNGWGGGWGHGWQPGWQGGWNDRHWRDRDRDRRDRDRRDRDRRDHDWDRGRNGDGRPDWARDGYRGRDGDRGRDRDRSTVIRTRPGEPAMPDYVPDQVAPDGMAPPMRQAPPAGRNILRAGSMPPPGEMRDPAAGFGRNRVQPGGMPGLRREPPPVMVTPPRAMPAAAPVTVSTPPRAERMERVERAQPSYQARSDRPGRAYEGNRGSGGRDVQQRVADD